MTPGLWIAVLCSASIFAALSWGRLCQWADTKVPVVGTLEPYRNWEPELPVWVDDDACPDAVTVTTDGRLKGVYL